MLRNPHILCFCMQMSLRWRGEKAMTGARSVCGSSIGDIKRAVVRKRLSPTPYCDDEVCPEITAERNVEDVEAILNDVKYDI